MRFLVSAFWIFGVSAFAVAGPPLGIAPIPCSLCAAVGFGSFSVAPWACTLCLPLSGQAIPAMGVAPTPLTAGESLQAVIDRGGPLVYVHKGVHQLNQSLILRSNQALYCESGAIIEAAGGAFLESTDLPSASLVVIDQLTNVSITNCTFRMRKADYGTYGTPVAPYVASEWRHGIRVTGSSNISLDNVKSNSSGGDGLYIGPHVMPDKTRVPCNDVTVRNSVFSDNYRQGISVLSCLGECLIEDCVMSGTKGASPQAGIDIEPEDGDTVEITVRRCQSIGNRGSAYIVALQNNKPTMRPSVIAFEACGHLAVPGDQQVLRLANVVSQVGQIMPNLPVGTMVVWDSLVWKK